MINDNKKWIGGFFCSIIIFIVILGVCIFCMGEDIEPITLQQQNSLQEQKLDIPVVNNTQVINLNTGQFTHHDLTDEEWEGIKGLRAKDKAKDYIRNNPECTLSEVVANVDGFGIKSAEKIELYILTKTQ